MQLLGNLFKKRGYGATDNPPSPPPGVENESPADGRSRYIVTNPFTGDDVSVLKGEHDMVSFIKQIATFSSGDLGQVRDEVNNFCQGLGGVQNPQVTVKKGGDEYIGVVQYINITMRPGG